MECSPKDFFFSFLQRCQEIMFLCPLSSFSTLVIFRYVAYVRLHTNQCSKLDPFAVKCVFFQALLRNRKVTGAIILRPIDFTSLWMLHSQNQRFSFLLMSPIVSFRGRQLMKDQFGIRRQGQKKQLPNSSQLQISMLPPNNCLTSRQPTNSSCLISQQPPDINCLISRQLLNNRCLISIKLPNNSCLISRKPTKHQQTTYQQQPSDKKQPYDFRHQLDQLFISAEQPTSEVIASSHTLIPTHESMDTLKASILKHSTLSSYDVERAYQLPPRQNRRKLPSRFSLGGMVKYATVSYVSTHRLLPSYQAMVNQMDGIKIPTKVEEALNDQKWKEAMHVEMEALQENGTWNILSLLKGKKTVGSKQVFTIKHKADGTIN